MTDTRDSPRPPLETPNQAEAMQALFSPDRDVVSGDDASRRGRMVGRAGLEPATPRLWAWLSPNSLVLGEAENPIVRRIASFFFDRLGSRIVPPVV